MATASYRKIIRQFVYFTHVINLSRKILFDIPYYLTRGKSNGRV